MNNFIKYIASKMTKPVCKVTEPVNELKLKECVVSFNFNHFYYNNEGVFNKPCNTLEDVSKSWTVMERFKYEKYVIVGLVKILKKLAYISDIFFVPVGWIAGTSTVHTNETHHVIVKVIFLNSFTVIKNKVKDYLSYHDILDVSVHQNDKEVYVRTFTVPDQLPSVVISLFPFCIEYILVVLFFGAYEESYYGITYVAHKEHLYTIVEILKPLSSEINIWSDEVTRFVTVKLVDERPKRGFPEKKVYPISEIVHSFNNSVFDATVTIQRLHVTCFVPKKIISLIDLPSNVPIKAFSKNGIDYITHINDKRLTSVLIIAKDDFMKHVTFLGTFKKENIIWKGCYTYHITEATFDVPTLKVTSSCKKKTCKKHAFDNFTFTTRVDSYIV
ncbi:gp042L [Rabbit fibroma virus]|uniref:Gp042L n=1 Tax=Rabbit fibroma virus (strain Kasza) TaxID=10272 RepID=Q9Q929_RFVKA|nr:hypothetical protein SFV_s042L [Rabbit fibroma virus]AAF17924.1 gp042L [Rabbit fibroma virus]